MLLRRCCWYGRGFRRLFPAHLCDVSYSDRPTLIIIIIIMTTCFGATQPVLSSAVQQCSLYTVAYRCRKQLSFQLATESIVRISAILQFPSNPLQ